MSYLVLARKYRPRSFEQLVGQPHVVQALVNALQSQRLHHAYLFTGTRGVGKTTVSRILAKSLNCVGADGQGGVTARPCGVCDACRDIDAGRHVDYVELDAASNRGVEEISQLLDQAVYKPVVGRFKVYMIDEVHMLSNHAFNAMLKTLEEPPEYLKFVLATTDPQKLPPTVLSRCLQFNLRPMAPQTVHEHLQQVLAQEGIEAEPGALRLLARAAQGSMRDGLSLTDQAIAYGAGRLEEAAVRQMLGSVDRGHAVRIVEAIAAGEGKALIESVDALRALGLSGAGLLDEIAAMLQQMAVLQAVPEAADADDPDTPLLTRLAALFEADETQLFYSIVLRGREELALAPDEYSGLVMLLLRMLAFRPHPAGERSMTQGTAAAVPAARAPAVAAASPKEAVSAAIPRREARASMPTVTPASPADAEPTAEASIGTSRALGDRWAQTVARLVESGAVSALVRELALQAECLAIEDGADASVWRLRVERESLRAPAQRERLQAALGALLRRPVRIEVEPGVAADSPALRDAAERTRRQREAERIIHEDPFVQSVLQQFKSARIVPGSVKPTVQ
jgi:DNA polymerase-3 subunit gamma/tau